MAKRKAIIEFDPKDRGHVRLRIDMRMDSGMALEILGLLSGGANRDAGTLPGPTPSAPGPAGVGPSAAAQLRTASQADLSTGCRRRRFCGLDMPDPALSWTWLLSAPPVPALGGTAFLLPDDVPGLICNAWLGMLDGCAIAGLYLVRSPEGRLQPQSFLQRLADLPDGGAWDRCVEPSLLRFLEDHCLEADLPDPPDERLLQTICRDLVDAALKCENPDKNLWIA